MNSVSVACHDQRRAGEVAVVRKIAHAVLRATKRDHQAISLFLLPPLSMRRINRQWHGMDKATNVLSFPESRGFVHPPRAQKMLGEIYLCPSYITAHGQDIGFMVVHGVLHLLGYDHIKRADRIRMERAERRVCRAIGIPWPYEGE
jgi:probable rRNA maturation factor